MEYNGSPESVGYKIKYSRADGRGKTLSHVVQDRVEREYTIEDLEEWTEYRVQVQAFNAIGSGPWSQTVMSRTRESGAAPWSQPPHPHPGTSHGPWLGHPCLCLSALSTVQGCKSWSYCPSAAWGHCPGCELVPAEHPAMASPST